jgi:hypothetical protein
MEIWLSRSRNWKNMKGTKGMKKGNVEERMDAKGSLDQTSPR